MLLRLFFFSKTSIADLNFFFFNRDRHNFKVTLSFYEVLSGDQPCQYIKMLRRFEDQLRPHLQGDWWPGILWSSIYTWLGLWRRAECELVLETSEHFNILTRLLARENFIEFSHRENIKTYNTIIFPWATFFQHPAPSSARVTATCLVVLQNAVSLTWTQKRFDRKRHIKK
jgi:hypothetical protein